MVHEYPVSGSSTAELVAQLDQCGPKADDGPYDGFTDWFVSWSWRYDTSNGCRLDDVKVHVRVDMYLPRWAEAAGSPLEAEWNAFATALHAHEAGHQQLAFDAADQAHSAISGVPADSDCSRVGELANQAANGVIDAFIQHEIAYDDDTDHGANQGVVFG